MSSAQTFYRGKTVVITGASSGIGESLAKSAAGNGASLVLLARRKEKLEEVAKACEALGAKVLVVACDVTRDGDLERAMSEARNRFSKIDVVIANAGFGVAANFEELSLQDYRRQFETNVFGVLRTAYAALDDLKKSRGSLALLGSVAGHVALPGSSPYTMSKFAVRAFAESVTEELRPHGVLVTLLSPGFVDSEIRKIDNQGNLKESAPDPIPAWIRVPADKASREILRAIANGRREKVVTGHGKLIVWLNRFFPLVIQLLKSSGMRGRQDAGRLRQL